jgi:ABC-type branched-subunit amino acid transport system substrate-binding protein
MTRQKKSWWIIMALVVTTVLVVVVTQERRPKSVNGEFRLSVIISLTGPVAPYGQSVLNRIRLATDEVNRGPSPHIKLIMSLGDITEVMDGCFLQGG